MRYIVSDIPVIDVRVYGTFGVIGYCSECPGWKVGSLKLAYSNTTFGWLLQACRIHKEVHEKRKTERERKDLAELAGSAYRSLD